MKIAFIGHKGYPCLYGGVEKVVEELVNRLADRGHECIVYSRKYYTDAKVTRQNVKRITINGIATRKLDTLSHTLLSLIDIIKRDVDIVTIHSFGNAIFNFIPCFKKLPVVLHLHGFEWGQTRFNTFEREILLRLPLITLRKYSDAITTVSVDQHLELNKLKFKNLLIPNGVEIPEEQKINRCSETNEKYILYVGRIAFQKGIEYLIQAFQRCNLVGYKLRIVGNHSYSKKYYEYLLKLANCHPAIDFVGYKYGDELIHLYQNAYCVVIPSEAEECPMVLLEAMSFNKCIIASNITSINGIAGNNVIYFENKNVGQLAKQIYNICLDPSLREEYESKVKSSGILKKYDWNSIVDQYEKLYENVLTQKVFSKKKIKVNSELDINLGFTNNFDVRFKVANDIIHSFDIKHKLYYHFIRPILTKKNRKRLQILLKRNVRYSENFINDYSIRKIKCNGGIPADFYPEGNSCSIVNTHDIDSEEGYKFIPKLFEANQKNGIRSCWYFVPYKYKIDKAVIEMLREAGDEIGVHGFNHDGKLFSSLKIFNQRVDLINKSIDELGAKGFRSPMVHRNLAWLQRLNVMYDTSCFDYDPFQPFPGGTGFIWPFKIGKLIELPYTIPQDHTLFYDLGQTTINIWKNKISWLVENHGMVLSVTHPDYLMSDKNFNLYLELIDHLKTVPKAWRCLPFEMAEWWLLKNNSNKITYVQENSYETSLKSIEN